MTLLLALHFLVCLLFFMGVPIVTAWLGKPPADATSAMTLAQQSIAYYLGGSATIWLLTAICAKRYRLTWLTTPQNIHGAIVFWLPALLLAVLGIRLILMIKYDVFLGTDFNTAKLKELPYYFTVIMFMTNVLTKGALVLSCWPKHGWQRRHCLVAYIFLGEEILYAMFNSRRYLLEIMVIFLIVRGLFWSRARFQQVIVLSLLILPVVTAGVLLMITMRNYYHTLKPVAGSAAAAAPSAIQRSLAASREEKLRYLKANLAERPLLIEFNRRIAEAQIQTGVKMNGQAFLQNLRWILPRFVFPEKLDMPTPEEYIENFYGMPRFDLGSNWAAFGLADGGRMGAFLAGLGFALALVIFSKAGRWLTYRFHLQFFPFCVLGAMVNLAVQVEQEPLDLLIFARAVFLFAICEYGFNLFMRFWKASIRHPKGLLTTTGALTITKNSV